MRIMKFYKEVHTFLGLSNFNYQSIKKFYKRKLLIYISTLKPK